ncbi:alcohol dehydrogenase [Streptomyces clavuligerus]|uniref:Alcohol dehydrogenase n=1 Tax=Streptomyces clavuligerus TaxID=1901 RepID=B5GNA3_STRCL|nr:alcohol dehydrogenase [Streptomyces clavuligerus]ANW22657.1 alcohol dehydrogenase [Streptomyces clavuligerus]AXU17531.1 alcohol dehydrogenase [Streptomyces clavuligerus]EDY47799.1 alcohol dehydrogenase [Streptomyces clavuligerus]EFG04214.1 Putative alcohol dehydrogenase [Streptomyces clavuligerus]MBY6307306.1 alcohol dehydrogenase catalytic domain-containing protein [Streptomyces clavuligerus]
MSSMRVAEVTTPGGEFRIVERELPEPGPGQVRIAVEACGICHTDSYLVDNHFPGLDFPLVTGHEVAGRIDALGEGVQGWRQGERVGVGWFGGHCGHCLSCRDGDFITCDSLQVPGWSYPGGFAEAMVAPANALVRIPDGLSAIEAAPLGCAGVTVYNSLRRSAARAGDLVAVVGLGGLGHLGVQYAAASGFDTVAVARGADKEELALRLGARHYIDSTTTDVAEALRDLGGATVVLATAANSDAMSRTVDGLAPRGQLLVIGVSSDPLTITPLQLINAARSVHGHPSGTARDVERAMAFAALSGVRPMVETAPLEEAGAAYERMRSGAARFRMVLTIGG